ISYPARGAAVRGDGPVAMAGGVLRLEHLFVDLELATVGVREQVEHGGDALLGRVNRHQRRHRVGTGIAIGLNERLCTAASTIDLNASPVGSTPTWRKTWSR